MWRDYMFYERFIEPSFDKFNTTVLYNRNSSADVENSSWILRPVSFRKTLKAIKSL